MILIAFAVCAAGCASGPAAQNQELKIVENGKDIPGLVERIKSLWGLESPGPRGA